MVELSVLEGFGKYFIERDLGLPSDKFYQDLDYSDEDVGKYYEECDEFNESKYKIKGICKNLLRYLESIAKNGDRGNSAYDDCLLLNYWIYGRIVGIHKKNSRNIIHAFGELQRVWNDFIKKHSITFCYDKCQPDFHMVMKDDWRKRKELYDYFVDYVTIKNMHPYYPTRCKEIYTYLKDKDVLYKEYSKHCSKTDNSMCPDFFAKNNEKDPNALLKKLSCYEEMRSMEALKLEQRQASAETDPGLTVVAASLPLNSQKARDGTNPVTNSGHVLLGVVVTSMTSGALYKFTPLGRMLRNGLGFNRNNINVHDNGLFEYAPGSFNPYSMGGDEHYIGYQPA
ncbi:Plasmodium vivax Vir protein, putative [Plasmodium vivax]|uniref:Vir protein, putative n=1 Tax=Plasmodium vivax TaxID=5855 RepID=A0A1G4E627_PLAVI|nr:Plasmodium vivax Vir protein, putative [Plasmodium vivax]